MKVLVAMSGGVDSTVTAHILKKQGHEVVGVNFNFAGTNNDTVGAKNDTVGAKNDTVGANADTVGAKHCEPALDEIAKKLNIKIIYRDYRKEFYDKVITSFVRDYESGITPNPCALCNNVMKFAKLLDVMKEENCDMYATGHYANVTRINDRYCIKKSNNEQKDQSYMLYRLNQEQLSHIIFPIGNMDKNEVRNIASELNLSVANKKDSQDVCFINDISYQEFIKRYEFGDDYKEKIARGELKENEILSKPYLKKGEFVDTCGKVLGFHNGIINYTIGQRKGLNIAFGERKFVVSIDSEKNQVVLGNNSDLQATEFKIYDIVYSGLSEEDLNTYDKKFFAKLRYRHEPTECHLNLGTGYIIGKMGTLFVSVKLLNQVRAITPGQSAVFYDEEGRVLFGGRIA